MSRTLGFRARALVLAFLACVFSLLTVGCIPKIYTFHPEEGQAGTTVVIRGARFGETPADSTVKFAGVTVPASDILSASTTQITARAPVGVRTGQISVTTTKGTGYSGTNFRVPGVAWTFMVYLDADNNLEGAGLDDFREMASVGSSTAVNIVVQMDRCAGYTTADGNWTGTRRFLIQRGDTPSGAPLQDLGEQNMGDPRTLQGFVEWGVTTYPAQRYALVIWNHGGGWRVMMKRLEQKVRALSSRGIQEWGISRAVASDETDNDELYMFEVQTALETARAGLEARLNTVVKLDLLGFDACLMGMVEVAYAVRNSANYVVGSEEVEPGDGWPYNTILADLSANPAMTPGDLGGAIVARYGSSYGSGVTQAAVDVAALSGLTTAIDTFATKAAGEWDKLKAARLGSRQYHYDNFSTTWGVDMWDFADRVSSQVAAPDIRDAASELRGAVDTFVVHEHHSPNMAGSHGIAIYFPPSSAVYQNDPEHPGYEESNTFMPVAFVLHHQWDNWLQRFYANIP